MPAGVPNRSTRRNRGTSGFTQSRTGAPRFSGIRSVTMSIRMQDSREYGPTGEEPFGTNIFGRFLGDLDHMTEGLEDGMKVYITELEL